MKHIISLGAGVQSSTMALMAAHGEITPMPDAAIFADTQGEPHSVYRWLNWLEKQLPFPVTRVSRGSLAQHTLKMRQAKDGRLFSSTDIPFFTLNADGSQGKIRNRSCTQDFKLDPLRKEQRRLGSIKRGQKTVGMICWLGISLDEIYRMKPSRESWCEHRFPLIEAGMRRSDCLVWMEQHKYPQPPRSACVYCPFHSDGEWRRLKNEEPEEFAAAVEFERRLQEIKSSTGKFKAVPFLHRSLIPLDKIDFSSAEDRGQLNLFLNECEGMCGV